MDERGVWSDLDQVAAVGLPVVWLGWGWARLSSQLVDLAQSQVVGARTGLDFY